MDFTFNYCQEGLYLHGVQLILVALDHQKMNRQVKVLGKH